MESNEQPINQVRRDNRAVYDEAWIQAFLQNASYGILATEWQGQPFVKPTLYVYNAADRALYFHAALEGRTRTNLEANPRASFCISEIGRLLPAKTAMEFGMEYASVVVFGKVKILTDDVLAARALQLLMDKYFPAYKPGQDYQPIIPEEVHITTVYCLEIESWSGKKAFAAPDYPGAFEYPNAVGANAGRNDRGVRPPLKKNASK